MIKEAKEKVTMVASGAVAVTSSKIVRNRSLPPRPKVEAKVRARVKAKVRAKARREKARAFLHRRLPMSRGPRMH